MSEHDDLKAMFDPAIYALMEALGDAEAALEMLGHDIDVTRGDFLPVGTSALRSIREAQSVYPDIRLHVERSAWETCEGCGEPAEHCDDDGVGTCDACSAAFNQSQAHPL